MIPLWHTKPTKSSETKLRIALLTRCMTVDSARSTARPCHDARRVLFAALSKIAPGAAHLYVQRDLPTHRHLRV